VHPSGAPAAPPVGLSLTAQADVAGMARARYHVVYGRGRFIGR